MKRSILLLALVGILPLSSYSQEDDMYFVPKKQTKTALPKARELQELPVYHIGCDRDVDEYNRRGRLKSYYQKIGNDSLGNDIIEFHEGDGTYTLPEENDTSVVYPGSAQYYGDSDADYQYVRNLGRFDDFYGWYDPFYYSYWRSPYWRSYYGWYDPWYDPLYYGWHNPWYYSGWYGWGYPHYHYGWLGWYPSYYRTYNGPTGTMNHSRRPIANGAGKYNYFGHRGTNTPNSNRVVNNGGYGNRNNGTGNYNKPSNTDNRNFNFGGSRNSGNNSSFSSPSSRPSSSPSIGGGSFGGSRGGGFGGSHGGGGSRGGFGGRR